MDREREFRKKEPIERTEPQENLSKQQQTIAIGGESEEKSKEEPKQRVIEPKEKNKEPIEGRLEKIKELNQPILEPQETGKEPKPQQDATTAEPQKLPWPGTSTEAAETSIKEHKPHEVNKISNNGRLGFGFNRFTEEPVTSSVFNVIDDYVTETSFVDEDVFDYYALSVERLRRLKSGMESEAPSLLNSINIDSQLEYTHDMKSTDQVIIGLNRKCLKKLHLNYAKSSMNKKAKGVLHKVGLNNFIQMYGDSFVTTVSVIRQLVITICMFNFSGEEAMEFASTMKIDAEKAAEKLKASVSSKNNVGKKHYQIYQRGVGVTELHFGDNIETMLKTFAAPFDKDEGKYFCKIDECTTYFQAFPDDFPEDAQAILAEREQILSEGKTSTGLMYGALKHVKLLQWCQNKNSFARSIVKMYSPPRYQNILQYLNEDSQTIKKDIREIEHVFYLSGIKKKPISEMQNELEDLKLSFIYEDFGVPQISFISNYKVFGERRNLKDYTFSMDLDKLENFCRRGNRIISVDFIHDDRENLVDIFVSYKFGADLTAAKSPYDLNSIGKISTLNESNGLKCRKGRLILGTLSSGLTAEIEQDANDYRLDVPNGPFIVALGYVKFHERIVSLCFVYCSVLCEFEVNGLTIERKELTEVKYFKADVLM